jgi:hypothetical protein
MLSVKNAQHRADHIRPAVFAAYGVQALATRGAESVVDASLPHVDQPGSLAFRSTFPMARPGLEPGTDGL